MEQLDKFVNWLAEQPHTRIPIFGALIALLNLIIGGLFTNLIYPFLKSIIEKLWEKLRNRFGRNAFEIEYLNWVIGAHKYLPILPSTLASTTQVKAQELDKLYVGLTITIESAGEKPISFREALRENQHLIVIGDPGAGKTTLLRYMAIILARARLKKSAAKNKEERFIENAKIRFAKKQVRYSFGLDNYPLPIFVYLNRMNDIAKWASGRSLLDAIRDEINAVDVLRNLPDDFFEEKLRKGECIFLLDAFDELGSKEARELITKHVGNLASLSPQGNRFIVTSRKVGYDGQLGKHGFNTVVVSPLSWKLIKDLVDKWYGILNEQKLGAELLETLESNPKVRDLAVNPMLLSLIALVQYVKRVIPEKRHILYDECVKILVERRYSPPEIQKAYERVLSADDAIRILQEISLYMHTHHLREIAREELEKQIVPDIVASMSMSAVVRTKPVDVLRNIEERSQLLVERGFNESGKPVMAFSHLTFQEFLTSVSLKEKISKRGEYLISTDIINHYKNDRDWWEEIALLYAAQLLESQRHEFLKLLYPEKIIN